MSDNVETLFLTGSNKTFFEKALKLYIFFRHIPVKNLPSDLRDRFQHNGNVVFSMITGFLENKKFSIEYMEYLNDELKQLSSLPKPYLKHLTILPTEINELELTEEVKLSFTDDDSGKVYKFTYFKETGKCVYKIES